MNERSYEPELVFEFVDFLWKEVFTGIKTTGGFFLETAARCFVSNSFGLLIVSYTFVLKTATVVHWVLVISSWKASMQFVNWT